MSWFCALNSGAVREVKKLLLAAVALALAAVSAWQYRLDLLLIGVPLAREVFSPVGPNVPTQWPQGPADPVQSADQRPPNVVLILMDDMGFNDVSLYNGGAGDGSVMTPNIDGLAQ